MSDAAFRFMIKFSCWWSCSSLVQKPTLHLDMIGIEAKWMRFSGGHFLGTCEVWSQSMWPEMGTGRAAAAATQQQAHVLPESPCEDGVQEGVAEGVDGIKKDEQDLRVRHSYEGHTQGCRDGKEGDWSHAYKVCENEHSHAFGNLGVPVTSRVFWVVNTQIYAYVTVTDHDESDNVENEHSHHVNLRAKRVNVHGQTDAHFAVTADPHKREQGNQQREAPACPHHSCHMVHLQPLVDMHGIGDGVPALKANHSQCIYW